MPGPGWRPAPGYLVLVGVLIAVVAVLLVPSAGPEAPPDAGPPIPPQPQPALRAASAGATATAAAASGPAAAASARAGARRPPSDELADHVPPGTVPSMGQVIERLHQAGIRTGLGAFNPPGTKPILIGLAVPEDFVLPAGYLRHHQTTDDGQPVEPILMFAPDHAFYDAHGRPVALPKDRVVPPEWAPHGMPLRRVVVPPPLASDTAPPRS